MARDYDTTTAWQLRQFWTATIQGWAAQSVKRVQMHDGTTRDAMRVVAALLGLLDHMRADGALMGKRDWWSLDQLARYMGMSRPVAAHLLTWLQRRGLLEVLPRQSSDGRESYERWLLLPSPSKEVEFRGALGPKSRKQGAHVKKAGSPSKEIPGAHVKVSSSPVDQSVDPYTRITVEGTAAKAAETNDQRSTVRGGDPEKVDAILSRSRLSVVRRAQRRGLADQELPI
jgi:hypothetical protein